MARIPTTRKQDDNEQSSPDSAHSDRNGEFSASGRSSLGDPTEGADDEFDGSATIILGAPTSEASSHGLSSEFHTNRALVPMGSWRLLRAARRVGAAKDAASRTAAPPTAGIQGSLAVSMCPRNAFGGFGQDSQYTGQEFADGDEAGVWGEDGVPAERDITEDEAPPGANQAAAEPAGSPAAKARRLPPVYGDGPGQLDWAEGVEQLLAAVRAAAAAVGLPSPEGGAEAGGAPAGAEAHPAATPGAAAMEGSAAPASAQTAIAGLAGVSMARSVQLHSAAEITVGQAVPSEPMDLATSSVMDGAAPGPVATADSATPLVAPKLSATMTSMAVAVASSVAAGGAEAMAALATGASSTTDSDMTSMAPVVARSFAAVADTAAAATHPRVQQEFEATDFAALIPVAVTGHGTRSAGHHKRRGRGRSWWPSARRAAPSSPAVVLYAGHPALPQQAWGATTAPPGAAEAAAGVAVEGGTKPVAASRPRSSPPLQHRGLRALLRTLVPRSKPAR